MNLRSHLPLLLACVALASTACGGAAPQGGADARRPCDPAGIAQTRPRFAYEAMGVLFDEDRAALSSRACRGARGAFPDGVDGDATDAELQAACWAEAPECRHACLQAARAEAAYALYEAVLAGVRRFGELESAEACREVLARTPVTATGEAAAALWSCMGLDPLPPRLSMLVRFESVIVDLGGGSVRGERGALEAIEIEGPFLAAGASVAVHGRSADHGCGARAWSALLVTEGPSERSEQAPCERVAECRVSCSGREPADCDLLPVSITDEAEGQIPGGAA